MCRRTRVDRLSIWVGHSRSRRCTRPRESKHCRTGLRKGCLSLRRAPEFWLKVSLPYEAATTRVFLAQAYRGMGDGASAELELRTARSAFENLDAQAVLNEVDNDGL